MVAFLEWGISDCGCKKWVRPWFKGPESRALEIRRQVLEIDVEAIKLEGASIEKRVADG